MTEVPSGGPTSQPKAIGLAVASLICSIAGPCTVGLGSVVGLLLGLVALKRIADSDGMQGGRGLAIAGVVISAIGLLIFVVIGLLVGAGFLLRYRAQQVSMAEVTRALVINSSNFLDLYQLDVGHYPTEEEGGLNALSTKPAFSDENLGQKWHGPYLTDRAQDAWGHPLVYKCPGQHNPSGFDLYSLGPDGLDGTADDIGNW